jgi:hypothetical protein
MVLDLRLILRDQGEQWVLLAFINALLSQDMVKQS